MLPSGGQRDSYILTVDLVDERVWAALGNEVEQSAKVYVIKNQGIVVSYQVTSRKRSKGTWDFDTSNTAPVILELIMTSQKMIHTSLCAKEVLTRVVGVSYQAIMSYNNMTTALYSNTHCYTTNPHFEARRLHHVLILVSKKCLHARKKRRINIVRSRLRASLRVITFDKLSFDR